MCSLCNEMDKWGQPPYYLRPIPAREMRWYESETHKVCTFYRESARDYNRDLWMRFHRNEPRRIPKRDPDDPRYRLTLGEGLLPFMFNDDRDMNDWYFQLYLPARRLRLYRLMAFRVGADAPEERAARGVESQHCGGPKLDDF